MINYIIPFGWLGFSSEKRKNALQELKKLERQPKLFQEYHMLGAKTKPSFINNQNTKTMRWQHKQKDLIITQSEYDVLNDEQQNDYYPLQEQFDEVNTDTDDVLDILDGAIVSSILDSDDDSSSSDTSSDTSSGSDFGGFGGGDSSGGGASGDW